MSGDARIDSHPDTFSRLPLSQKADGQDKAVTITNRASQGTAKLAGQMLNVSGGTTNKQINTKKPVGAPTADNAKTAKTHKSLAKRFSHWVKKFLNCSIKYLITESQIKPDSCRFDEVQPHSF